MACHVLNLCVQDGLQFISHILVPIRNLIVYLRQSAARRQDFKKICDIAGKKFRKFPLDINVRWNSTFRMLQAVRGYELPIIDYYNENIASDTDNYLSTIDFEIANNISDILSAMEMAINSLSGSYYPTAHLLLPTIVQVAHQMHVYADNNTAREMIAAMQMKFLKYYEDIPLICCVACALDPTVKFYGLEKLFNYYNEVTPN